MPDYGNPSYWDERYSAEEEIYDWYQDYSSLKSYFGPYLKRNAVDFEILIPGCGNSRLGADLYDDGFLNVTNIDISSVVITQMSDRFADKEEMEFSVMDALQMEFIPDECFDLIIDKALLDAQLCGDNNISNTQSLIKEMHRVLKPGGIYAIVSHGGPETRFSYFKPGRWTVDHVQALKPPVQGLEERGAAKYHHIYFCQKC